jgi:hypothetical protein
MQTRTGLTAKLLAGRNAAASLAPWGVAAIISAGAVTFALAAHVREAAPPPASACTLSIADPTTPTRSARSLAQATP